MSRPMRGTTYEQDPRYKDKESKLLASNNWPLEYSISVDVSKVNLDAVRKWVNKQTKTLLGVEDEILDSLIINEIESKELCPKKLQILITGFLGDNAKNFTLKLWRLLLSAQNTTSGTPEQIICERREELLKKKRELEKAYQEIKAMAERRRRRSRSR